MTTETGLVLSPTPADCVSWTGSNNRPGISRPRPTATWRKTGSADFLIAKKLRVSQPTASEHLRILSQAHLIRGKRIKKWTFYKRDEKRIVATKKEVVRVIGRSGDRERMARCPRRSRLRDGAAL